jgi:ADP-ribosylglycohydrolase
LRADCEAASLITHRNTEAVSGARAVALAVAQLATGKANCRDLMHDTAAFIPRTEVARNLQKADGFLAKNKSAEFALFALGTGGYVVETIASAFYCFCATPDNFEETVIAAVMGGDDTDTTASIAGALSGAHNGLAGIPERWLSVLEDRDRLLALARDLFNLACD